MSLLFDLHEPTDFAKITLHKASEINRITDSQPIYIDFQTNKQPSSGFLITLPTIPQTTYVLQLQGELQVGERVFVHCQSQQTSDRLLPRTIGFNRTGVEYHLLLHFQASTSLTEFGLLSWSAEPHRLNLSKCQIQSLSDWQKLLETPLKPRPTIKLKEESIELKEESIELKEETITHEEEIPESDQSADQSDSSTTNSDSHPIDSSSPSAVPLIPLSSESSDHLPELLPSQFILPSDLNDQEEELSADDSSPEHEEEDEEESLDQDQIEYETPTALITERVDDFIPLGPSDLDENMLLSELGLDRIADRI